MDTYNYEYRAKQTSKYANKEDQFISCVLGVGAEAGEIQGKVEKRIRKGRQEFELTPSEKNDILKEAGDVLWFLTMMLDSMGSNLDVVMKMNLNKLADRDMRNVIHGSGDER